jgi:tRNA pseudouridine55 synthase
MPESCDGIILLAKQSGISSFSSLWQIKNALGTKKIGHTGTLDTFAEGLLVALAGRLTRLAPYITNCDKEYEALVEFGSETDTLDPDGIIIRQAELPSCAMIVSTFDRFTGNIMQSPPAYSALHIDGQRASDLMRKGAAVTLPPRPVSVHSITVLYALAPDGGQIDIHNPASADFTVSRIALRISCSKGTYIRSLARDIALSAGSCSHLAALRRTRIGPFSLESAAGCSMLAPFGTVPPAIYGKGDKPPRVPEDEIRLAVTGFTPEMSVIVGLSPVLLDAARLDDFLCGKKPSVSWFLPVPDSRKNDTPMNAIDAGLHTVFCDLLFVGMVRVESGRVFYDFVAGGKS